MKILITTGAAPDLDGISSALGYVELLTQQGKECVAGFEGKPQLDAEFMLKHFKLNLPAILQSFDEVILVDMGNKVYAPQIVQRFPEMVVKVIDHRVLHNVEMEFPSLRESNLDLVGACATMVTEELYQHQVTPSHTVATLLYAAIYSNTLYLKAGVTTERDLRAAECLAASYPMSQELIEEMFAFRTRLSKDQLVFVLQNDFDVNGDSPDGTFGIAQLETLDASSLFAEYREIIHQTLLQLREEYKLDYVFLTAPGIKQEANYLYAPDEATRAFLCRYFAGHLAPYDDRETPGEILLTNKLLLRKEIKPIFQHAPAIEQDL